MKLRKNVGSLSKQSYSNNNDNIYTNNNNNKSSSNKMRHGVDTSSKLSYGDIEKYL